jgi:NAD-dependent dihydropyrimidine dehydrogenase PreA subunit
VAAGAAALASLAIVLPFCRWLCPFAAVLHPFSRFGLARIKRDAASCGGCRACSRSCPMAIAVHEVSEVTAARCISCMSCLEACPGSRAALAWGPPARLGRRWSQAVLVAVLLACTGGAVSAAYLVPMPSFVRAHGTPPEQTATLRLKIENLSCRGRANLLVWFLQRDDLAEPLAYFKLEAWPGPGAAAVRITFDPAAADEELITRAITEPYFQISGDDLPARWFRSPFRIEGDVPEVPSD